MVGKTYKLSYLQKNDEKASYLINCTITHG